MLMMSTRIAQSPTNQHLTETSCSPLAARGLHMPLILNALQNTPDTLTKSPVADAAGDFAYCPIEVGHDVESDLTLISR